MKYVIPLFIISVIGTAAATVMLFTHTFPVVHTVVPVLTTTCTNVVNATAAPFVGHAGNVTFTCPGGPAFTNPFGTSGSATPMFTLGSGYTRLFAWVFQGCATLPLLGSQCGIFNNNPPCTLGSQLLQNGVSVTFPLTTNANVNGVQVLLTATDFYYCADFTSAPAGGFSNFMVTWNQ